MVVLLLNYTFAVVFMKGALLKFKLSIVMILAASTAAYAQAAQTYLSYVRQAFLEILNSLRNLSTSAKTAILAALIFLAVILYLRTRSTASNNMRKARDLHKKAVELHERGNDEEAVQYYKKSSEYREKAELQ